MTSPARPRTIDPKTSSVAFLERYDAELQVALDTPMSSYFTQMSLYLSAALTPSPRRTGRTNPWIVEGADPRFNFNPGLARLDAALRPQVTFDQDGVIRQIKALTAPPMYFANSGAFRPAGVSW